MDEETEQEQYTNIGQIGIGPTSITYKLIDKKTKQALCKKVQKYNDR